MNRRLALSVLGAAGAALLCQCNAKGARSLVVFAASSLREVFIALGTKFEGTRPGTTVTFHFAGSQELRTQLEHGAKADVFASADPRQLQLGDAQTLETSQIFAWNEPVLAVSRESASKIRVFSELPRAARIVIGAPEVPIGRYTLQLLELAERKLGKSFRSAVEARVVSRELNVRQVLSKVSLGEADAGIVYRSDVPSARGAVTLVAIPVELNVLAEYPIARLHASAEPELAREFIDLVLSHDGKALLKSAGFRVDASATAVAP